MPPADQEELLLIDLPSTILPSGARLLYPLVTLRVAASEKPILQVITLLKLRHTG